MLSSDVFYLLIYVSGDLIWYLHEPFYPPSPQKNLVEVKYNLLAVIDFAHDPTSCFEIFMNSILFKIAI